MVELAKNPQYWRKCAEWARRIANAIHDEQARRLMLSVAKDYERAAELNAPQPAMRSPDKEREPVPVGSDAERPMPNAWRDVHRRPKG
jgi:hypothetical protein